MSISTDQARAMVARAVRRIVPDADVQALPEDADLRRAFDLDSLDFLSFVELLVSESGVRIDEDDYPDLGTTAGCSKLLVRRTAGTTSAAGTSATSSNASSAPRHSPTKPSIGDPARSPE